MCKTIMAVLALVAVSSAFAQTTGPAMQTAPARPATEVRPSPRMAVWGEASSAPAYAGATAHEPGFDDRALWPALSGKEYFLKEKSAKGRLYVWAHPGKSGIPDARQGLDPTDPKNWLQDGKPAEKLVFDDTADLLLPPSETAYVVGFRGSNLREVFRHVTIERGASFQGGGDGVGRQVYGNVWIKRGGKMYAQGATTFLGGQHTFFRSDNDDSMNKARKEDYTSYSQYFQFNKDKASVEFLGQAKVLDEFFVNCLVIVGPDSYLQPGRSATPTIGKAGTLALLDGAYWGKWTNEFHRAIDLICDGTLQGGLPDRPLTRNCTVGLSFRNWQKLDFSKWSDDPKKGMKDVRLVSMIVKPGATIRSYTADPQKACLTITWTGIERTNVVGDPYGADEKALGMFKEADFAAQFNSIPRKITVYFDERTLVDGVRFDNVHTGGILMKDPSARLNWKNVLFGQGNMAGPEELFKPVQAVTGGSY